MLLRVSPLDCPRQFYADRKIPLLTDQMKSYKNTSHTLSTKHAKSNYKTTTIKSLEENTKEILGDLRLGYAFLKAIPKA